MVSKRRSHSPCTICQKPTRSASRICLNCQRSIKAEHEYNLLENPHYIDRDLYERLVQLGLVDDRCAFCLHPLSQDGSCPQCRASDTCRNCGAVLSEQHPSSTDGICYKCEKDWLHNEDTFEEITAELDELCVLGLVERLTGGHYQLTERGQAVANQLRGVHLN